VRRRGGAVRLQPPGEGRVRGDRADAGGADLRRAATRVVGRRARAHGFHRPPAPRPRAAPARARGACGVRRHAVPPHLADVAQGRPDLGLPRRHRRAAHRVRPVRLLHGGHDRARGADSPLQGGGAPMTEGLVGLTVMMLLAFLRVPIGYAMGLVGLCGISGSPIGTAATMAKLAYPAMKRFGDSDKLAACTVASAGTLGIMIPPSTIMVIYGIFTETNIGKLFMAGILPGILGACLL